VKLSTLVNHYCAVDFIQPLLSVLTHNAKQSKDSEHNVICQL